MTFSAWASALLTLMPFNLGQIGFDIQSTRLKEIFTCFRRWSLCNSLLQRLWDPASWESREATVSIWLVLFLHRHLLHCGLWGRHTPNLALSASGGHSHLCCLGGAPYAGKLTYPCPPLIVQRVVLLFNKNSIRSFDIMLFLTWW